MALDNHLGFLVTEERLSISKNLFVRLPHNCDANAQEYHVHCNNVEVVVHQVGLVYNVERADDKVRN